ncbi:MAG TPA: zf-HC2 domain-containing protein [Gemmatimonadaceae bacterium]|nr:zf-HC2 domain-containing protein [Gemmatimonadaceae bacterium]
MNEHLTWEDLNDVVDDVLAPDDAMRARAHLASCAHCSHRRAELEVTLAEVARAAREIPPPAEAWPAVRAEIESRKVVPLAGMPARRASMARFASGRRWTLVAAGIVLVAASSFVTAVVMDRTQPAAPATVAVDPGATITVPVAVVDAERSYLASVQELSAALEAARPHLSAQTIEIVERNLALIDAAITESRAALLRDPGNRVLLEVLAGTYRQKLELLRRAAQLATS